jgi:predicted ester cyclase
MGEALPVTGDADPLSFEWLREARRRFGTVKARRGEERRMTDRIETNRATVERFLAGTHAPDIEDVRVIDDTVTEDVVCHGFPGMNPTDRESYKAWFRFFRAAFTGIETEVPVLVADVDHVAARWIVSVNHTGPFAGVAPTGRRVVFDGVALYRMRDGRIAETWLYADEMALLQQIGAMPQAS